MSSTSLSAYQLVFQLPGSTRLDFEVLLDVENELRRAVVGRGTVDGHDMGSGEMNIFVLTDRPIQVFEQAKTLPAVKRAMSRMRVAFRPIDSDAFEILFPPGLYEFQVR